jgi:hypothetical protein
MSKPLRVFLVLIVIASLMSATGLAVANGTVDPPTVDEVMYPGTSVEIDKTVTTPPIPPVVDICLLEDETGSFYDDIENLQLAAPALYATIVATSPDAQFAVAGFRDYPVAPYGIDGDWVYHLLSTMSPDEADWLAGVGALTAYGGNDEPEAQYDAIVAATGPGTFDDPTLGLQDPCGWRDESGVQHVLVVATDAPFHTPDGTHVNDEAATIAALNAEDIILIGLKAPGAGSELDALATATGGSVQPLSSDGANIATAILDALEELTADVWWTEDCGPALDVSLTPDVYYDVLGNTSLDFVETVAVPNATPPGDYYCAVTFLAGEYGVEGAEIGTQDIHVEVIPIPVPLDIKPTSCPNPVNTKSKGVLPVAILGAEDFDVSLIDPATIELAGATPLRWAWSDAATPFEPWLGKSDCREDCTSEGPDGYLDLTLKFRTQEVLAGLGSIENRECLVVTITGNFTDGRAFEGEDVVLILHNVK